MSWPGGFLWGTGASSTQCEGAAPHSDWLAWELAGRAPRSGDGNGFAARFREDFAAFARLGLMQHRLSIEWARIEPEEGWFSLAALEHYRRVLAACHEQGVRPCVTFHHFSSPRWFTADGGWEDASNIDRFLRYCERAVRHLGDLIDTAYTINEANLMATLAAGGILPPDGYKSRLDFVADAARRCGSTLERFGPFLLGHPQRISDVMLAAHGRARTILKSGPGDFAVGELAHVVGADVDAAGGRAHQAGEQADQC